MKKITFCSSVCPWAIARSKEMSTWRGLAVLAAATGVLGVPEQTNVIIGALGAIFGASEIVKKE